MIQKIELQVDTEIIKGLKYAIGLTEEQIIQEHLNIIGFEFTMQMKNFIPIALAEESQESYLKRLHTQTGVGGD